MTAERGTDLIKATIFMAITANGFIAKEDDDTGFISDVEWKGFLKKMKEVGSDIIGRRTYELALEDGWFPDKNAFHIVMSKKRMKSRWENVVFTDKSPREALRMMAERGFNEVLIGGGTLAASFMKQHLVDELILDVEPKVFGRGIGIFTGSDFDLDLELIGVKKLSKNEVQLHYRVLK